MKRRTRIMKELETSEVVLARLREERALLDARIAQLEERRQADVLQLIVDTATRFNLAQLPAASIVAGLELLAQSACVDRPVLDPGGTDANSSDDPQEELVPVIVRLTRNTSAVNRVMLENAGVRWNGRAAGWSGRVTPDALRHLREIFPGRVKGPDLGRSDGHPEDEAGPTAEADRRPATSPDVQPAIMEADTIAPAEDRPVNVKDVETGGGHAASCPRRYEAAGVAVPLAVVAPPAADLAWPWRRQSSHLAPCSWLAGCGTELLPASRVAPISSVISGA
ncbi:hypothetical protein [Bradyrhizobium sp.]|uniref:hypothetical protein n=1 Tax=Bradyrhizobium sp. TaxID=376 RepID=UPI002DDDB5EB|nr:hypothetical protein [Bradyrhizobium sp.]HEV2159325.1 hypothetical protein [Bradyrhizobium sp.]